VKYLQDRMLHRLSSDLCQLKSQQYKTLARHSCQATTVRHNSSMVIEIKSAHQSATSFVSDKKYGSWRLCRLHRSTNTVVANTASLLFY